MWLYFDEVATVDKFSVGGRLQEIISIMLPHLFLVLFGLFIQELSHEFLQIELKQSRDVVVACDVSATPFVTTNWTTSTCSCCAVLN